MSYSRTQERGIAPVKSLLLAMLVALVSLFAVGCGDSGEDFVVTGNNGGGANTGAVTFQFQRAQQVVPTATAFFDIRFFNANGAQVFEALNVPFNTTVTVNNVPTSATSAVVTAKNAAGVPLQTINYTVAFNGATGTATAGNATDVTFTALDTTPANVTVVVGATAATSSSVSFSDGTSLSAAAAGGALSFTSSNAAVATVSAAGVITGVSAGTATVTSSYVLNGVTRTDTVTVTVTAAANALVVSPATVTLTNTTTSQVLTTTINGSAVNVGGTLSNLTGGLTAANLTFNNATKTVAVDAAAFVNGTATLTLTSGTASATVPVTVTRAPAGGGGGGGGGTPARLVVDQANLFVPIGGTTPPLTATFFPTNSTVGVSVPFAQLQGVAKNANPAGTENRWAFNVGGGTITAGTVNGLPADNNTVVFTITHTPSSGAGASTDITVTALANGADPRLTAVLSSQLIGGTSVTLPSNATYPFVVVNTLGNGTQIQATPGAAVGNVSFDPASSATVGTFGTSGGSLSLTAAAVPAAGNVIVRRATSPTTFATVGTVAVTVVNTNLRAGGTPNVILTPSANAVKGGTALPFKVEWLYENGTRQDVTPFYSVGGTGPLTPTTSPVNGLSTGIATTTPVAALTPGTLTVFAGPMGGLLTPGGVAEVASPAAAINVVP